MPLFTSTSEFRWIFDKIILCSKFRPSVPSEGQVLYELHKTCFVSIWDKSHKHAFKAFKNGLITSSAVAFYTLFQSPQGR